MRRTAIIGLAAALAAGGPAAGASFFAAGFSGGYAQAVALGPQDEVVACRASAELGEGLAVRIERWAQAEGVRIWLQSDRAFDVHLVPVDVVADGRRFDLPAAAGSEPDGARPLGAVAVRLTEEVARALASAERAALAADGYEMALPPGVARALRFVERCGA